MRVLLVLAFRLTHSRSQLAFSSLLLSPRRQSPPPSDHLRSRPPLPPPATPSRTLPSASPSPSPRASFSAHTIFPFDQRALDTSSLLYWESASRPFSCAQPPQSTFLSSVHLRDHQCVFRTRRRGESVLCFGCHGGGGARRRFVRLDFSYLLVFAVCVSHAVFSPPSLSCISPLSLLHSPPPLLRPLRSPPPPSPILSADPSLPRLAPPSRSPFSTYAAMPLFNQNHHAR